MFLKSAIMVGMLHQQPCRLSAHDPYKFFTGPAMPGDDFLHGTGMALIDSPIEAFVFEGILPGTLIMFSHP
ncbi:MAG TPA: hypothetical protein VFO91_17355 [Anaerolineales bacterium]|nr:hypothetical protein [Anaerolineales bacterium]